MSGRIACLHHSNQAVSLKIFKNWCVKLRMTIQRKYRALPLSIILAMMFFLSEYLLASVKEREVVPTGVTVNVGRVHKQRIPDFAPSLGTLEAVRSTGLSFLASGHLSNILFKDGSTVKKGDIIAQLDNSTVTSELASAKANLEEAQSNYNRYDLLKDSGVFSKQDYISVTTTLKVAKAKYASILEQEQRLSLQTPFSGTLGKFNFSVGAQVSVGTVIVDLVQLDPLRVTYSLNQVDKSRVSLGQIVWITSDTWPGKRFKAKVSYISPTINSNTGRFNMAALLDNPDLHLSPGGLVHVKHILGEGHEALVVPQAAVNVDGSRSYVYMVADGKAHQTTVLTGNPTDNGNIIILDGLTVGDSIVVYGTQKLSEGSPVIIVPSPSKEAPGSEEPSAQNVKEPSDQNVKAPSAQEMKEPSVQNMEAPSAQKMEAPSAQEMKAPSAQKMEAPSAQKMEAPSAQEMKSPSAQEMEAPSAQEMEAPSAMNMTAPSKETAAVHESTASSEKALKEEHSLESRNSTVESIPSPSSEAPFTDPPFQEKGDVVVEPLVKEDSTTEMQGGHLSEDASPEPAYESEIK